MKLKKQKQKIVLTSSSPAMCFCLIFSVDQFSLQSFETKYQTTNFKRTLEHCYTKTSRVSKIFFGLNMFWFDQGVI